MIDIDFNNFNNTFTATDSKGKESGTLEIPNILQKIVDNLGGVSYNNGLFVIYSEEELIEYTQIIERIFPQAKDKIYCFGRDWLNRQFAVINYEPFTVLQFDSNYKDISHIEVDLKEFYEKELILKCNTLCAEDYFSEWGGFLKYPQCAGYITPLFLGGKDVISNLQIIDARVDLELIAQLMGSVVLPETTETPPR